MSIPAEAGNAVSLRWEMEIINEEVGTDDAEVICGVANDCVLFPQNNDEGLEVVTMDVHPDFLDIQVVEEEVVGDSWENQQSSEGEILQIQIPLEQKYTAVYEQDEVEIPLPQDQDSYTTMRPYPCDFCSRRFRKKANLTNHMIAHQSDRPHGCNMCGARYHRKSDLVTHMKIHAYAPGQDMSDDEDVEYGYLQQNETKIKGRRQKPVNPRKRKSAANNINRTQYSPVNNVQKGKKNNAIRNKSNSSASNYVDEDMKLMMQSPVRYAPPPERKPITDPSRPYVCQHCGVGFAREKALGSHSRMHAGDSPFECTSCGEMFWDLAVLREHSKTKHGVTLPFEEEIQYTGDDRFGDFHCETCGLSFHRQDLLKRHRRVHIKPEVGLENQFVCQVCSSPFPDQADLLAHVETHARYQPHRCMLCGECFMDASAVAAHVRRRHAKNIPPNACIQCGKTCKDRRSLQKHSWVHSVERSFSCFKCGKRFHSRARLKRHMVSHRDKAVNCDDCGEEFPDGRALINHRHSHTKELGSRQFHCNECGKTFGSRSSQQIHARIHTGERPYGCRFCWKAFADGGTLRKHERIHTGEKPYACPVCPRAFNQRVVLREHIRSHHSGPEHKVSNHLPMYVCKVCSTSFNSSEDLCAHLISHSDENTAKHRAPRLGPRKYKRRRKLNSAELTLIAGASDDLHSADRSGGSASEMDDFFEEEEEPKETPPKKRMKLKRKSNTDRNLDTVVKTFESVVENFNSFVDAEKSETKKSKRKLKTSQKKKNLIEVKSEFGNDEKVKKPGAVRLGGFVRSTRPTGEPRVRPRTKNVSLTTLAALKPVSIPEVVEDQRGLDKNKAGPRTKNVNYHNVKMAKLSTATFPAKKSPKSPAKKGKAKAKRKAKAAPKKPAKPASTSPRKPTYITNAKSPRRAAKANGKASPSKSEAIDKAASSPPPPLIESVNVKSEYVCDIVCEMCGESFSNRSELLIHVPIHI